MSKIWASVLFLVMFFSISVPITKADIFVYNATIKACGFNSDASSTTSGGVVYLKDNSATPAWPGKRAFYLSAGMGNQGIATMLTAFSTSKTVTVKIAGDASAGSLIKLMYIEE